MKRKNVFKNYKVDYMDNKDDDKNIFIFIIPIIQSDLIDKL